MITSDRVYLGVSFEANDELVCEDLGVFGESREGEMGSLAGHRSECDTRTVQHGDVGPLKGIILRRVELYHITWNKSRVDG